MDDDRHVYTITLHVIDTDNGMINTSHNGGFLSVETANNEARRWVVRETGAPTSDWPAHVENIGKHKMIWIWGAVKSLHISCSVWASNVKVGGGDGKNFREETEEEKPAEFHGLAASKQIYSQDRLIFLRQSYLRLSSPIKRIYTVISHIISSKYATIESTHEGNFVDIELAHLRLTNVVMCALQPGVPRESYYRKGRHGEVKTYDLYLDKHISCFMFSTPPRGDDEAEAQFEESKSYIEAQEEANAEYRRMELVEQEDDQKEKDETGQDGREV
ncbi:MAG: hypothetical protein LQ338_008174 [Usnochroma carphineum]|nr:MAG: hypothetical protein LQ338_008174 [Usnochroma carphineum]